MGGSPAAGAARQPGCGFLAADVTAPSYDVIGPDDRCALLERSPFKGVEIDPPLALGEAYPYEHAA